MSLSGREDEVEKLRLKDCEQVMTMIVRVMGRKKWAAEDLSERNSTQQKIDMIDLRDADRTGNVQASKTIVSTSSTYLWSAKMDKRCEDDRRVV